MEDISLPLPISRAETAKRPAPRKRQPKTTDQALFLKTIIGELEDAKAEEIITIDLAGKSSVADGMIVASGRSSRHVGAIAEHLVVKLKENGCKDVRVEGLGQCDWVLVDSGDVIIHIFRPEVRGFYNLEKLWSEAAPTESVAH